LLTLEVDPQSIKIYNNRLETDIPAVTRYGGEAWDRIASDILCGTADATEGVRIVIVAAANTIAESEVSTVDEDGWSTSISDGSDSSYFHKLADGGWLFVPMRRDAVEEVMAWTMPALDVQSRKVVSDSWAFALAPDTSQFAVWVPKMLAATNESSEDLQMLLRGDALFSLTWTWGFWEVHPGRQSEDHLIRLVEPVVSRINTTLR
jgi:hypothetical protein